MAKPGDWADVMEELDRVCPGREFGVDGDPVALLAILKRLPDRAGYDALVAAVAEHERWRGENGSASATAVDDEVTT